MASTDFEVRQLLKAYRSGLISEQLFIKQIDELCGSRRTPSANGGNGTTSAAASSTRPTRTRCARRDGYARAEARVRPHR
jgi:hypothetical protein